MNTTTDTTCTMTLADAAADALRWIARVETQGTTRYVADFDAPDWVYRMLRDNDANSDWGRDKAHSWLTDTAAGYQDNPDEDGDAADALVDTYTADLVRWLSDEGTAWCDEALEEFGEPSNTDELLRSGQNCHLHSMIAGLRQALEAQVLCSDCETDARLVGQPTCLMCMRLNMVAAGTPSFDAWVDAHPDGVYIAVSGERLTADAIYTELPDSFEADAPIVATPITSGYAISDAVTDEPVCIYREA